jgi:hypothetical protein
MTRGICGTNDRHPLRGFAAPIALPTGSRTHPWLYSGIPSGFNRKNPMRMHESLHWFAWVVIEYVSPKYTGMRRMGLVRLE